jgi:hypothetical protein
VAVWALVRHEDGTTQIVGVEAGPIDGLHCCEEAANFQGYAFAGRWLSPGEAFGIASDSRHGVSIEEALEVLNE